MGRFVVMLGVVVLGASACLGGSAITTTPAPTSTAVHAESGVLTTHVDLNTCAPALWGPCGPATHLYKLTCAPTAGTMPHRQAACAALADYQSYLKSEAGPRYICGGLIGRPTATAVVSGTYAEKHFLLRLDNEAWCGASMRVMRDYWALSTFPCSVVVIHTQNIHPYSRFAHASGCLSSMPNQGRRVGVGRGTWVGITRAAAIRAATAWFGGDAGAARVEARFFAHDRSMTDHQPVWVVAFIGGRVCVPMTGPPGSPSGCATHWLDVVVDAHTGRAIEAGSASGGPYSNRAFLALRRRFVSSSFAQESAFEQFDGLVD